jgi:hypothetical protein
MEQNSDTMVNQNLQDGQDEIGCEEALLLVWFLL